MPKGNPSPNEWGAWRHQASAKGWVTRRRNLAAAGKTVTEMQRAKAIKGHATLRLRRLTSGDGYTYA